MGGTRNTLTLTFRRGLNVQGGGQVRLTAITTTNEDCVMITIDWTALAPWAVTVFTLALLAAHSLINSRRIQQLRQQLRDHSENVVRELNATSSGSIGVGNRVIACERQLHELRSLFDEMRQNDPLRVSYDEASRLVDLGADVDDLMNTCGISRPEAELVSALSKRQRAA